MQQQNDNINRAMEKPDAAYYTTILRKTEETCRHNSKYRSLMDTPSSNVAYVTAHEHRKQQS